MSAAVHLQRDVGLMQTNVDVLNQNALSLQKAASRIIDICLGPSKYPASEVEMGTLGPRVYCQTDGEHGDVASFHGALAITLYYTARLCWGWGGGGSVAIEVLTCI